MNCIKETALKFKPAGNDRRIKKKTFHEDDLIYSGGRFHIKWTECLSSFWGLKKWFLVPLYRVFSLQMSTAGDFAVAFGVLREVKIVSITGKKKRQRARYGT